jgi:hypothetical protein
MLFGMLFSVVIRGFLGERFTADSTFTFRFTEDNYNSYASNGWVWTPSSASTVVKLSVRLLSGYSLGIYLESWSVHGTADCCECDCVQTTN